MPVLWDDVPSHQPIQHQGQNQEPIPPAPPANPASAMPGGTPFAPPPPSAATQAGYLLATPPSSFDTTADDMLESWRRFKTNFEIYETISELSTKTEKYRRAILLMCLGEDARCWMDTVQIDYSELTATEIMKEIEKKCVATITETLRDYKFFSRDLDQKRNESFDAFYERIRAKSRVCKFGEVTDRLIRSRLIIGLQDKNLQRVLLSNDLPLPDVVSKCRSSEIGALNAREIQRTSQQADIIAAINTHQNIQDGSLHRHDNPADPYNYNIAAVAAQSCTNCGYAHGDSTCYAKNKQCSACGKTGHYAKCCRSTQARKAQNWQQGRRLPNRTSDQTRGRVPSSRKNVWTIEVASDDEDFSVCQFTEQSIPLNKSKKWDEIVEVHGQRVTVKIDTGAQVSVLPAACIRHLEHIAAQPCRMLPQSSRLVSYFGDRYTSESMAILALGFGSKSLLERFCVVNEAVMPTIRGDAAEALGLIKRISLVDSRPEDEPLRRCMATHPAAFEGIGCIRNYKCSIQLKPHTRPPEIVVRELDEEKRRSKKHYDQGTRPLAKLKQDQLIRILHPQGNVWKRGTVVQILPQPRSYIVKETDSGATFRRNRQVLREDPTPATPQEAAPTHGPFQNNQAATEQKPPLRRSARVAEKNKNKDANT